MSREKPRHRIWVQGATDRVHMAPYLARLEPHLQASVDPGFAIEFHTTTPPATTTHALTEFRIARAVIRGAIEAEKRGYDAVTVNHFQDAGLAEAKSAVDIPVHADPSSCGVLTLSSIDPVGCTHRLRTPVEVSQNVANTAAASG